jgi:hypothetical protein
MEVERLDLCLFFTGEKGMHGLGEGRIMFNYGFGGVGCVPLTCLLAIDIQIDDFIEFFGLVGDTEVVFDRLVKQVPLRHGNPRGGRLVLMTAACGAVSFSFVLLLKDTECVSGCRNMDINYMKKKTTLSFRDLLCYP